MVAVMGSVPGLVAVNAGMFPVPIPARPMAGLLLLQENVVPAPTGLVTEVMGAPTVLQKV